MRSRNSQPLSHWAGFLLALPFSIISAPMNSAPTAGLVLVTGMVNASSLVVRETDGTCLILLPQFDDPPTIDNVWAVTCRVGTDDQSILSQPGLSHEEVFCSRDFGMLCSRRWRGRGSGVGIYYAQPSLVERWHPRCNNCYSRWGLFLDLLIRSVANAKSALQSPIYSDAA